MPGLLTNLKLPVTIERETYQLFAQTMTGTTTTGASVARTDPFYIAVTLTDFENGEGLVTVTGTLSGVTVTSSLTFTGNQRRVEMNQIFDTLVSVQTTGFSDSGAVRVDAVSRTGQAKEELTTIAINVMCKV